MEADQGRAQPEARARTVDEAADVLRRRLVARGSRLSHRQNCESMQRVHVSPSLGNRRVDAVTPEDVDRLARAMLERGLAPKTVRNVMTFLHGCSRSRWRTAGRAVTPSCALLAPDAGVTAMRIRICNS